MTGLLGTAGSDWTERGARVMGTNVVLFRSVFANACLTHRLRALVTFGDIGDHRHYRYIGLCGFIACGTRSDYGSDGPGYVSVKPNDETFICHRCHAIAERHGIDTFGLIPDTGCSATGGVMYRPWRKTLSTPSPVL